MDFLPALFQSPNVHGDRRDLIDLGNGLGVLVGADHVEVAGALGAGLGQDVVHAFGEMPFHLAATGGALSARKRPFVGAEAANQEQSGTIVFLAQTGTAGRFATPRALVAVGAISLRRVVAQHQAGEEALRVASIFAMKVTVHGGLEVELTHIGRSLAEQTRPMGGNQIPQGTPVAGEGGEARVELEGFARRRIARGEG